MKISFLIFIQSICFSLVGQNTTSYVSEYELAHWAEGKHVLLSDKIIEKMYSHEFDLFDSIGNKLDTSQINKILYEQSVVQVSSQVNNYEQIFDYDSVSGKIKIYSKQIRETDYDSIYDTLVQIKNLQYSYSLVFKGDFVGISYTKKPDYIDDYVYISLRDFNRLLNKELELYIQYFKKSSILHFDSIYLESNRIMRNLNYKIASLTISGDVMVYSDNNLKNSIDKDKVSKLGLHQSLPPKDTLENGIVLYDTIYTSVLEHLPSNFSQLYFVFDNNFRLTAISSFYYMLFGGVAIGERDLGFVKKKDAFNVLEEDNYLILTLIDYASKLKLSIEYEDQIEYIKERSKHLKELEKEVK